MSVAAALALSAVVAASTDAAEPVSGMPPVVDPTNLYSETAAGKLAPAIAHLPPRVYVPHLQSNAVWVIDVATMKVLEKFKVGITPQHVVPSWNLSTLWVTNNAEGRSDGTRTAIDGATGKPVRTVPVDDPYNMTLTPDGKSAAVLAEAMRRQQVMARLLAQGLAVTVLHTHPNEMSPHVMYSKKSEGSK